MKMTLANIKAETHNFQDFYDDKYGFLNKAGVVGQLSYDMIRVMHPRTGQFSTWVVAVDMINAGINDEYVYSDMDADKTPTKDWKTALARAVQLACREHEIVLEQS